MPDNSSKGSCAKELAACGDFDSLCILLNPKGEQELQTVCFRKELARTCLDKGVMRILFQYADELTLGRVESGPGKKNLLLASP